MKLTVISTAYFNLLHAIFKQQKTYPREYGGIDIEHICYPRQRTTPPKRSVHLFYGTNETRESLLGQCVNRCHVLRVPRSLQVKYISADPGEQSKQRGRRDSCCSNVFVLFYLSLCHGYFLLYQFVSS